MATPYGGELKPRVLSLNTFESKAVMVTPAPEYVESYVPEGKRVEESALNNVEVLLFGLTSTALSVYLAVYPRYSINCHIVIKGRIIVTCFCIKGSRRIA